MGGTTGNWHIDAIHCCVHASIHEQVERTKKEDEEKNAELKELRKRQEKQQQEFSVRQKQLAARVLTVSPSCDCVKAKS